MPRCSIRATRRHCYSTREYCALHSLHSAFSISYSWPATLDGQASSRVFVCCEPVPASPSIVTTHSFTLGGRRKCRSQHHVSAPRHRETTASTPPCSQTRQNRLSFVTCPFRGRTASSVASRQGEAFDTEVGKRQLNE